MEIEELHPCQLNNLEEENGDNGSSELIEVKLQQFL